MSCLNRLTLTKIHASIERSAENKGSALLQIASKECVRLPKGEDTGQRMSCKKRKEPHLDRQLSSRQKSMKDIYVCSAS